VKHFKFSRVELHKRRPHKPPSAGEVRACLPWLSGEVSVVQPALIALGSVAAKAILGAGFRVTRNRGQIVESSSWGRVFPTARPSSVLRAGDAGVQARAEFFRDIALARKLS
jgi:DNA polymerase